MCLRKLEFGIEREKQPKLPQLNWEKKTKQ